MKLYNELAEWWPLLSPPEDYAEEAAIYFDIIYKYKTNVQSCLELGSGGGNNALYFKQHFDMTMVDWSERMLEVSKRVNPECRHIQGDMRTIRLVEKFDMVFIHDAISYLTTLLDLKKVISTASIHLGKDGLLLIMPDEYKETYSDRHESGGSDRDGKSLRYLEWTHDPDPDDGKISVEYAYILKDEKGNIFHENDHAECGLFSKNAWENLLKELGFRVHFEQVTFSDLPNEIYFAMVAIKL